MLRVMRGVRGGRAAYRGSDGTDSEVPGFPLLSAGGLQGCGGNWASSSHLLNVIAV